MGQSYTINDLRDDIVGLAVAWQLAATKFELVKKMIAIIVPQPQAMSNVLMKNPVQWVKSAYRAYFQLPLMRV